ncbi:serine/arginine repetitive matrix protein 1-like [Nematostella vectensis]|uniref:serine/arginine repetitive matrix protein 1-like n=1 Tax=Nematostella vectensis TaxID=45351 RepID=UPI0013905FC1|nr:serine/arginine repetitive matrix protein 1-like [Nematostella vectensis]
MARTRGRGPRGGATRGTPRNRGIATRGRPTASARARYRAEAQLNRRHGLSPPTPPEGISPLSSSSSASSSSAASPFHTIPRDEFGIPLEFPSPPSLSTLSPLAASPPVSTPRQQRRTPSSFTPRSSISRRRSDTPKKRRRISVSRRRAGSALGRLTTKKKTPPRRTNLLEAFRAATCTPAGSRSSSISPGMRSSLGSIAPPPRTSTPRSRSTLRSRAGSRIRTPSTPTTTSSRASSRESARGTRTTTTTKKCVTRKSRGRNGSNTTKTKCVTTRRVAGHGTNQQGGQVPLGKFNPAWRSLWM